MSTYDPLNSPEVRVWSEGFTTVPGLLETVAHWVGFSQVLVTLRFIWPAFLEVQGCVLLPWEYDAETFAGWQAELPGDHRDIENVVNHLHLWDVFDASEVPDGLFSVLGEVLEKSWRAALADQVPGRRFEVRFSEDAEDYGPTVSIISL